MDSVAETIAGMSESIEAIEEVGAEIELIALNASIKAAHTGEAGAALGVLATAIQHLSADARRQTDAVSRILGDIAKASEVLQENARRYNDQSEAWAVIGELDAVLADMGGAARRRETLFTALARESTECGQRATTVGRGIDFDRDIVPRLSELGKILSRQVEQAKLVVPQGGKGRGARLRALFDRYTMAETENRNDIQYLTFTLERELFALDIGSVREVLELVNITRVPRTPDYIRGVINLRGRAVPVVDLKLKFGMISIRRTSPRPGSPRPRVSSSTRRYGGSCSPR